MRQCLFICFCCMWSCLSHAQETVFPFQWVELPSDVKEILAERYNDKNCGAESNVYNIGVRNDVEPQNGVYWYHGMGPHFPHKVFVYYNNEVYVLKGDVEHSQDSITQDFPKSVDSLKICKADSIAYLNAIMNTLAGKKIKTTSKKKLSKKDVIMTTTFRHLLVVQILSNITGLIGPFIDGIIISNLLCFYRC